MGHRVAVSRLHIRQGPMAISHLPAQGATALEHASTGDTQPVSLEKPSAVVHTVEPHACRHHLCVDGHRGGTAALDRSARALSPYLRTGLRPAFGRGRKSGEADPSVARRPPHAVHDRQGAGAACADPRAAPGGVRCDGAQLPRGPVARQARSFASNGVLLLGVARRNARRTVQHACGAGTVRQHRGVSARRAAGVPDVPCPIRRRRPAAYRPTRSFRSSWEG